MAFDFQAKIDKALAEGATPQDLMTMLSDRPDLQKLIPYESEPVDNYVAGSEEPTGLLGPSLRERVNSGIQSAGGWLDDNLLAPAGQYIANNGIPLPPNPVSMGIDALQGGAQAASAAQGSGAERAGAAVSGAVQGGVQGATTPGNISLAGPQQAVTDFAAGATGLTAAQQAIMPDVLAEQVEMSMADPDVDDKKLKAIPQDATPEEVKAVVNEVKADHGRKVMMDSGASPEALSAWDSFAGKVDLMTFGLSMMNLTDGQGSLTSKVARSMQAGIDAKTAQGDKASGSATAARKEARDERELRTKEVKAASDAQLNAAKYNEALANAQKLLASAEGQGGDFIDNPQILGAFTEMAIAREIRNPEAAALDLAQSAQRMYTEAQAAGLTDFSVADAFDASVEQASAKVGSKFYDKWGWGR